MTAVVALAVLSSFGPAGDATAVAEHPHHVGPPILVSFNPEERIAPPPPRPARPTVGASGAGCSRVGTFSRADLAACFGNGWPGLIYCESSGDSRAVNPRDVDGRPKFGAFQFDAATWDWAAADLAGRPDLVGVAPHTLPMDTQWLVAEALRSVQGLSPWGCGWAWGS